MIEKTNGYLEQYYQDCKSGKEIVGFELMLQLEQLMQDLQSHEFIYDTTEADRRIDFIENCCKK